MNVGDGRYRGWVRGRHIGFLGKLGLRVGSEVQMVEFISESSMYNPVIISIFESANRLTASCELNPIQEYAPWHNSALPAPKKKKTR